MADESYNLLISNTTEMNENKHVAVNIKDVVATNKKANAAVESKCKIFFFNDVDLVSTDNIKLATLTNNIILTVSTQDVDGKPICYVHYFYRVTCHGWSAKVPVHVTLFDGDGARLKKIPLREIEIYGGCKGMADSRIEYFDTNLFEPLKMLNRGGDNSRWIRC
jgi:hypothetical protein